MITRPSSSAEPLYRPGSSSGLDSSREERRASFTSSRTTQYERIGPPVYHQPPPPLAPYVGPHQRFFAPLPEDPHSSDSKRPEYELARHHPSIPPPQRPAPSYIHPPPPPPLYRGTGTSPPSPPASQGQVPSFYREYPTVSSFSSAGIMSRSHSEVSMDSSHDAHERSGSSSDEGSRALVHSGSEPARALANAEARPRKRTRALMTHMQQSRLNSLWRETKFPNTQRREELGAEVGLTPRQVQVWFQNRRQSVRKQISQTGVPEGMDTAEYEELQKSPRSRRMSHASEDRVSQWASSSSTSISSGSSLSRFSGRPILSSLGEISSIAQGQPPRPFVHSRQSHPYRSPISSESFSRSNSPSKRDFPFSISDTISPMHPHHPQQQHIPGVVPSRPRTPIQIPPSEHLYRHLEDVPGGRLNQKRPERPPPLIVHRFSDGPDHLFHPHPPMLRRMFSDTIDTDDIKKVEADILPSNRLHQIKRTPSSLPPSVAKLAISPLPGGSSRTLPQLEIDEDSLPSPRTAGSEFERDKEGGGGKLPSLKEMFG